MRGAFKTQFDRFNMEDDPWKQVKGPTTAMFATLKRINWYPADYDKWITDDKEVIDLKVTIPFMVAQKIKNAVDRRLWEKASIKHEDPSNDPNDEVPNWNLARRVILGPDKQIGAMAMSVTINTRWSV